MTLLQRMGLIVLLAIAIAPVPSLAGPPDQATILAGEPTPAWVTPVKLPTEDMDGPLVQILADTQFRAGDASETYVHKVLVAHDISTVSSVASLTITYIPEYQTVHLHQISLLRGGERLDRTHSAQIRVLQRETGLEQGVYSGEATISVLLDDVRVGDRVEYAYSTIGSNPIFGRRFIQYASWDLPYPTLMRRVEATYPEARKIRWRIVGDAAVTPDEVHQDGLVKLVFSQQNMAARPGKANVPSDFPYYSWLQFSEYENWSEIAAWADDLFRIPDALPDELSRVADRLRLLPNDEARAVAALEFVQSEIRYFSISFGESSHRPTAPSIVLERRFGDCKDKTLLLLTLLKAVGVQARAVLVNATRDVDLDRMLPSPFAFDHVLVQVNLAGRVYYLDPVRVGQHGRLDRMGNATAGASALEVRPQDAAPFRLPAPVSDRGDYDIDERMKLPDMDGPGRIEIQSTWRGLSAELVRAALMSKPSAELIRQFSDRVDRFYGGATEDGEGKFVDDQTGNTIVLTQNFLAPKLAAKADYGWAVRYSPVNFVGMLSEKAETDRAIPLALRRFPFSAHFNIELELPETVRNKIDPSQVAVDDPAFHFQRNFVFRGNLLRAADELTLRADHVDVGDLAKYNTDYAEVDRIVRGVFIIPKALLETATPARARSLEDDSREQGRAKIADLTRKITAAEAAGNRAGLVDLYCLRSYAQSDIGLTAEAMADAERIIKMDPHNARPWACRASADYAAGDFDRSLADYNHAVALGSSDQETRFNRGVVQYFIGDYAAAAEDFTAAIGQAKPGDQLYPKLWLALALGRQGKDLPDALSAEAASGAKGEWPRPALAMLAGKLSIADCLAPLEAKSGDDRALSLTEGEFYAAGRDLIQGDRASAARRLQRVIGFGAIIFTEYVAAKHELHRLEAAK